jgi:hypothetical protein
MIGSRDMRNAFVASLGIVSLSVTACSSTPRNFAPRLSVAPGDPAQYEQAWLECREQVAASSKGSKRGGSAAAGLAAGAGAGAAGAAATSGATYATIGGAAAAGAVVIAAVPVLGLAGAWGYSKIKKTKREKAIKAATAECLDRSGYEVAGWRVLSKREVRKLKGAGVSPKLSEQSADGADGSAR